jgi:hypothetical protein
MSLCLFTLSASGASAAPADLCPGVFSEHTNEIGKLIEGPALEEYLAELNSRLDQKRPVSPFAIQLLKNLSPRTRGRLVERLGLLKKVEALSILNELRQASTLDQASEILRTPEPFVESLLARHTEFANQQYRALAKSPEENPAVMAALRDGVVRFLLSSGAYDQKFDENVTRIKKEALPLEFLLLAELTKIDPELAGEIFSQFLSLPSSYRGLLMKKFIFSDFGIPKVLNLHENTVQLEAFFETPHEVMSFNDLYYRLFANRQSRGDMEQFSKDPASYQINLEQAALAVLGRSDAAIYSYPFSENKKVFDLSIEVLANSERTDKIVDSALQRIARTNSGQALTAELALAARGAADVRFPMSALTNSQEKIPEKLLNIHRRRGLSRLLGGPFDEVRLRLQEMTRTGSYVEDYLIQSLKGNFVGKATYEQVLFFIADLNLSGPRLQQVLLKMRAEGRGHRELLDRAIGSASF